jgi:hypothetical protein
MIDMFDVKEMFDVARRKYPGSKKGLEREYTNFIKRSTKPTPDGIKFNPKEVVFLLLPAIDYQIRYRYWCKINNTWVAQWKNFQTWINKGCWEEEYPEFKDIKEVGLTEEEKAANKTMRESLKRSLR